MTLCAPPAPIHYEPPGTPEPWLDALVGSGLAREWRVATGQVADPGPYGVIVDCDEGYLGASLSSLWLLLVAVIAFTAGMSAPVRRRAARVMLLLALVVSLSDFIVRVVGRCQRVPAEHHAPMIGAIPLQLLFNALFLFALPFALGLAVGLLAEALRWLVIEGARRLGRTRLSRS